ncbi:GNAT family N-acetyltransferase [Jiangella endophytica]|uniref:GNAT family N-acetyltransferase n=1 Tax=Jiangella endophytica TaxID=1623398 RepID=UPI0013005666|nr:GNAT family protein [Jiangella endophytica]
MEIGAVTGERTTLRPWRADDAAWYVAARDDQVLAFTTERADLTVAEVVAAIEAAHASDSTAAFAIEDEHHRLVGNLAAEITGDTAEISYFLAPDGRGRGLMIDAIRTWSAGSGRSRSPRSGPSPPAATTRRRPRSSAPASSRPVRPSIRASGRRHDGSSGWRPHEPGSGAERRRAAQDLR